MSHRVMFACLALAVGAQGALAGTITLDYTIRDFKVSHPDFEGTVGGLQTGAVQSTLGGDGKPVPTFGLSGPSGFTTASNFNEWYNDVGGVNQKLTQSLTLNETGVNTGIYKYESSAFFPIDGLMWGNEGNGHNYHFTVELNSSFTYQGGETFSFTGDDDLWVFINDELVIDLGGVHSSLNASVNLDSLGLTLGQTYDFDLFFAERHTVASNFKMETSIELDNVIPMPQAAGIGALGLIVVGSRRRRAGV